MAIKVFFDQKLHEESRLENLKIVVYLFDNFS